MKKSLLAILLAVVLVSPVFAVEKGDKFINAKVGLGVSNNFKLFYPDSFEGLKMEEPFSVGAEFFYGIIDNLSLGLGASYVFDTSTKENYKLKCGTTNIYLAVKPEAKIDSDIFSSIYLTGQIGLAMLREGYEGNNLSIDNGLYLAAGAGTTIKDVFFIELIISSSNGSYSGVDVQYTATTVNVGYKFTL